MLTLNYGDAWGLDTDSYSSGYSLKERVAKEAMEKSGCDRDLFEDCWDEVWKTNDQLPVVLHVIKRNESYKNKVLDSLKKLLGDEVFNNKSYTTEMFEEKDAVARCEKIGVTPQQMVDFLKSLY